MFGLHKIFKNQSSATTKNKKQELGQPWCAPLEIENLLDNNN